MPFQKAAPSLLAGLLLLLLCLCPAPGIAQSTDDANLQDQIRKRVEAHRVGLEGLQVDADSIYAQRALVRLYESRGFTPAWTTAAGPSPRVDTLLTLLSEATLDGLQPRDYHARSIQALVSRLEAPAAERHHVLTDLDLLCSDAFLMLASHLLHGHVSPTELVPSWNVPGRAADLASLLNDAISSSNARRLREALASVRPKQDEYAALTGALAEYRRRARQGGWPTVSDGPKLETGMTDDRVGELRRRLQATGETPSDTTSDSTSSNAANVFDEALAQDVMRFQRRHGLEADGVVGPATRAALNVSAEARVKQILVNLERWRWLPDDLGQRYVLVNIAAFTLRVVENGSDVMTMRVVTGRPFRQTPVFSGTISYLVLNPFWHVPPSLAVQDKLPEIQKNPAYFTNQNIKVFQGWGAAATPVDPSTVDWSSLSAKNFPYRLRQDPGPLNALGRVKFMFPNPHNVYLHDTPTRGLFARESRSFSSGCIRLERPLELTEYLLGDQPAWTSERIQNVLKTPTQETTVVLKERVPVHLQYWTAWADRDGTVHFREDVYTRDQAVLNALTSAPPSISVAP